MKKIFTLLVALTTIVCGMNAEKLLTDSFPQAVGDLTLGSMQDDMGTDQTKWYYSASTTTKIQVVDTALTFPGYCSSKSAKAIKYTGNCNKAVRAFNTVNSGSIYYGVLINARAIRNSTTKDYIACLTDGTTTANKNFARLNILNNYSDGTFQVGVSKAGEAFYRLSNKLPKDSTYLIVVGYYFMEGANNDSVNLWINPTKMDSEKPTLVCVDTTNASGTQKGPKTVADASIIKWAYLKPGTNTPTNLILDEFRVATKWADLFEGGGGGEPAISVNTSLSFDQLYQGNEMSKDVTINAENLKGDIAVSHNHADITLSASTITKAAAEAGATLQVTLKANTAGAQADTIVLTTEGVEKKIVVSWTSYPVVVCANIAALKDSVKLVEAYAGLFRLNGEAVVTRDTTIDDREIYLQDATGAVKLFDSYGLCGNNLVGAKVNNFILNNGEEALGILPFYVSQAPTIISTGNTVEPQEVTLSELQANATDYLYELVKIKDVTFDDAEGSFAVGQYAINQATETANVKVENNNIVGKTIPTYAHVIGFSFNTSGSVILPRNIDDIKDANPELLKNGSFEKWKVSSGGMFGTNTDFEDWNAPSIAFGAKTVDSTDVMDGKYALKTTSALTQSGAYIYQEVDCQDYAQGDEFKVRIGYKNLNDSVLTLACYWETSKGSTEEMKQGAVKQVLPSSKSDYKVVEVKTTKPEGARYFVFKVEVPQKAQVLIDNCAFTYVPQTPTAVEKAPRAAQVKARKFISNGKLYIQRDGAVYTITGQKL